jgi:hypothetical protein
MEEVVGSIPISSTFFRRMPVSPPGYHAGRPCILPVGTPCSEHSQACFVFDRLAVIIAVHSAAPRHDDGLAHPGRASTARPQAHDHAGGTGKNRRRQSNPISRIACIHHSKPVWQRWVVIPDQHHLGGKRQTIAKPAIIARDLIPYLRRRLSGHSPMRLRLGLHPRHDEMMKHAGTVQLSRSIRPQPVDGSGDIRPPRSRLR